MPAPGSTVSISPAFLNFFNAAEKVSSTLSAGGGTQPMLNFIADAGKDPGSAGCSAQYRRATDNRGWADDPLRVDLAAFEPNHTDFRGK